MEKFIFCECMVAPCGVSNLSQRIFGIFHKYNKFRVQEPLNLVTDLCLYTFYIYYKGNVIFNKKKCFFLTWGKYIYGKECFCAYYKFYIAAIFWAVLKMDYNTKHE